jgi:elongator complex protein 3
MRQSIIKKFIKKAIQRNLIDQQSLESFKKEYCRELRKTETEFHILSNSEIKKAYLKMLKSKEIAPNFNLEKLLITKKIRTLSGVAVVAVLTKSYPCPGKCIYCPSEKTMPKSYLSNEPAVMRAIANKFHPYAQTQSRLKMLEINGHSLEKIETIVMGGTFSYLPHRYQNWFVKECFRTLNDYPKNLIKNSRKSTLEIEKKRNETAKSRMIGLTLETRPDFIDKKEIENFRKLGATRVELGVQSVFDDVLDANNRGHQVQATVKATKLLKEAGFKINYHIMPGMYKSSPKQDLEMFKILFSNPDFQPDMLKIYPCVVTKNSEIYNLWKKGIYKPLNNTQIKKLLIKIKKIIPPYVRITRLIRDIPEESIEAGPNISNLRQILQQEKVQCECIRCREIRADYEIKEEIILNRIDYPASDGTEIFLQFTSKDQKKLFALLRLRINSEVTNKNHFLPVLKNSALIRELHTYGQSTGLNQKNSDSPQHLGLGKKLIKEAEKIAREEFNSKKIAIIAGVGVRKYYENKLGYKLENEYMTKKLV